MRVLQARWPGLRAHYADILAGRGPESLHQYRVTLRRLRAWASGLRAVLPKRLARELAAGLRELAKPTGRLRDLDVLLQAEPACRAGLPAGCQVALARLFARLRRQRGGLCASLYRALRSEPYQATMARIESVLTGALQLAQEAPSPPIGKTIRRRLRQLDDRFCRRAARLAETSPDRDSHRLRLRGKRLRYLLELSEGLVECRFAAGRIRALRGLQDRLGRLHDLVVRQHRLKALLSRNEGAGTEDLATRVALQSQLARAAACQRAELRREICRAVSRRRRRPRGTGARRNGSRLAAPASG